MILHGELAGGTLIAEEDLARRLDISRTPVREALSALLHDGLVAEAPRRQLMTAVIPAERLAELIALREACELLVVRAACDQLDLPGLDLLRLSLIQQRRAARAGDMSAFCDLDDDFHIQIAVGSEMRVSAELLRQLRAQIRLALLVCAALESNALERAVDEHESIVDAVEDRDAERAASAMTAHLDATRRRLEPAMSRGR